MERIQNISNFNFSNGISYDTQCDLQHFNLISFKKFRPILKIKSLNHRLAQALSGWKRENWEH